MGNLLTHDAHQINIEDLVRWDESHEQCSILAQNKGYGTLPRDLAKALAKRYRFVVKRLDLSQNQLLSVPRELSSLRNVKNLSLADNLLSDVDGGVLAKLSSLETLDVSYNVISKFEGNIGLLGGSLKQLYLKVNQLTHLPASMSQLTALETLSLSHNHLTELSLVGLVGLRNFESGHNALKRFVLPLEDAMVIPNLQRIDLQANHLTELPPGIGALPQLTRLNLSFNQLTELSDEIGQLTELKELCLNDNRLLSVSDALGRCTNLLSLRLQENALTGLADAVCACASLQEIDLSSNQLAQLPPNFGSFTGLFTLLLNYNHLTSLPDSFGDLVRLAQLELRHNHLAELPASIGNMRDLTKLDLSCNRLTRLPDEIANLPNLLSLSACCNLLTELPTNFSNLTKLRTASLAWNGFRTFPHAVTSLGNLEALHLGGNFIDSLPDSFASMSHLMELSLGGNCIQEIPASISSAASLRSFNISSNQLRTLPIELGKIFSLTTLNACDNEISSLPDNFFECLQNLEELDLSSNKLTAIPSSIGSLESLTSLDLSENCELSSLPERTASLLNLSQLKLYQCAFTTLPPELASIKTLTWVSFEANPLTHDEKERIVQSELAKIVSLDPLQPHESRCTAVSHITRGEIRGMRPTQEDTLVVSRDFTHSSSNTGQVIAAIFDGHRGAQGAITAALNYARTLSNNLSDAPASIVVPDLQGDSHTPAPSTAVANDGASKLKRRDTKDKRRGASSSSRGASTSPIEPANKVLDAMAKSFSDISSAIIQSGMKDGCTAVTAAILDGFIYVANVGDSRAVLSRNGHAIRVSFDHKAMDAIERERIQSLPKGFVADRRVCGDIAVSRSLGDARNQPFVVCEPYLFHTPLSTNEGEVDEFLVLACDGVWDVLSDQEVVDLVRAAMADELSPSALQYSPANRTVCAASAAARIRSSLIGTSRSAANTEPLEQSTPSDLELSSKAPADTIAASSSSSESSSTTSTSPQVTESRSQPTTTPARRIRNTAAAIRDAAYQLGSSDNISALVIHFATPSTTSSHGGPDE